MAPKRRPSSAAAAAAAAAETASKLVLRQPAARAYKPKELCPGLSEAEPCRFSNSEIGRRAGVQPSRGQSSCCFCAADVLKKHLKTSQGKGSITIALAFFHENDDDIYTVACRRITSFCSQEVLDQCLDRLKHLQKKGSTKASRARNAKQKREQRRAAAAAPRVDPWVALLEKRKVQAQPTAEDKEEFKQVQRAEARKLAQKLPAIYDQNQQRPTSAWRSSLAEGFSRWACRASWTMCSECHRLEPHKFWPTHVRQQRSTQQSQSSASTARVASATGHHSQKMFQGLSRACRTPCWRPWPCSTSTPGLPNVLTQAIGRTPLQFDSAGRQHPLKSGWWHFRRMTGGRRAEPTDT